ncbi:hypothetical protein SAMN05421821_102101 [Mucilaginibacter lappiensis]|uniref:Uncharacterized protein n=1 Tax=Mucilaginibacter lappiensis TaxID=354630 RepID=A0ABR6PFY2_9SPHI|nr:hypothetical protein [Mucilaginibacter lappiensis]MBB6108664.1 hypothetical protein [Mucilaginibacter lappiensis]SIQ28752.1 hypothetical protein SAMN05421821_102101 [Mucilaginibacter lappiensis]
MEASTICYEFNFRLTVRKRDGKLYKNHHIIGIGLSYSNALWDVFHTLKKRKTEIITVQEVKPRCIAFAFDRENKSVKISLAEYPPVLPDDLNKELNYLPKKSMP